MPTMTLREIMKKASCAGHRIVRRDNSVTVVDANGEVVAAFELQRPTLRFMGVQPEYIEAGAILTCDDDEEAS